MNVMEEESVKLINYGQVAELVVNRPKELNALNPDVLQSLSLLLDKIRLEGKARVVLLSASGDKAFVAGADVRSMSQLGPRAIADFIELGQRVMRSIECFELPVIAAVNGYALGGGLELALACDLILASDGAKLGFPEINLGIIPGFGGTQRLLQRAGIGVARRLVYGGEMISASEALSFGIVDRVIEHAVFRESVMTFVEGLAAKAPCAIRRAKQVLRAGGEQALVAGLRQEVEAFLGLFATSDREEGMNAFLQKRAARFEGR